MGLWVKSPSASAPGLRRQLGRWVFSNFPVKIRVLPTVLAGDASQRYIRQLKYDMTCAHHSLFPEQKSKAKVVLVQIPCNNFTIKSPFP